MIEQRADALVALIERRRLQGHHLQQLDGFRTQRQEVEKALSRMEPLVSTWHLFRAKGVGDVAAPADAALLLDQLSQLRGRYDEDPTSVLGPYQLDAVKSGTPNVANALEQQLRLLWDAYVRARIPNTSEEVLNVLSQIRALKAQADHIRASLRALNARRERLPTADAEIEAFDREVAQVNSSWNAFDSRHLSTEVLRFLKDAGAGGAALESLTESVREWLEQHDLTTSFRIRPASSVTGGL